MDGAMELCMELFIGLIGVCFFIILDAEVFECIKWVYS